MKKLVAAAAVLLLAGCAHVPVTHQPQVNRAKKADKLVVKKVEQSSPNQVVQKRWFPKFRVQWLHPK